MPISLLPYINDPDGLKSLISEASSEELAAALLELNSQGQNIIYLLTQITWRNDAPKEYIEIRNLLRSKVTREEFATAYRLIPFTEWKKLHPGKALYNAGIDIKKDEELASIIASCTQAEIDSVLASAEINREVPFLVLLAHAGKYESLKQVFEKASFVALNHALCELHEDAKWHLDIEVLFFMPVGIQNDFRMKLNYTLLCKYENRKNSDLYGYSEFQIYPLHETALNSAFFSEIVSSMSDEDFDKELGRVDHDGYTVIMRAATSVHSRRNLSALLSRAHSVHINREINASPMGFFDVMANFCEVEHIETMIQKAGYSVFNYYLSKLYKDHPDIWNKLLDRLYERQDLLYRKANLAKLKSILISYGDTVPALYIAAIFKHQHLREILMEASAEDTEQALAYNADQFLNAVKEYYPQGLTILISKVSLQVIAKILVMQDMDPDKALLYAMLYARDLRKVIQDADQSQIIKGLNHKTIEGWNALQIAATSSRDVLVAMLDAAYDPGHLAEFESALLLPTEIGYTALHLAALYQTELPIFIKLLNLISEAALNSAILDVELMTAIIQNQSKETFMVLVIKAGAEALKECLTRNLVLIALIFEFYGEEMLNTILEKIKLAGIKIDKSVLDKVNELVKPSAMPQSLASIVRLGAMTAVSSAPLTRVALRNEKPGDVELVSYRAREREDVPGSKPL